MEDFFQFICTLKAGEYKSYLAEKCLIKHIDELSEEQKGLLIDYIIDSPGGLGRAYKMVTCHPCRAFIQFLNPLQTAKLYFAASRHAASMKIRQFLPISDE